MPTKGGSRKCERGAAALEFAIVLPVLLLLLVGIVDFGMVMGAQTQVANAAREGARAGALTGKRPQAISAATGAISGMPGATNAGTSVDVICTTDAGLACSLTDSSPDTGGTVTVTVTYVHTWLSPALLGFSPNITLHGQSQMRIEA
nr:TadE/TadG family type IV pilus assembly protein [Propionicimonas sp.]